MRVKSLRITRGHSHWDSSTSYRFLYDKWSIKLNEVKGSLYLSDVKISGKEINMDKVGIKDNMTFSRLYH